MSRRHVWIVQGAVVAACLALGGCAGAPSEGEWVADSGESAMRLGDGGHASFDQLPVWTEGCDSEPDFIDGSGRWYVDGGVLSVYLDDPVTVATGVEVTMVDAVSWGEIGREWSQIAFTEPCESDTAFVILDRR